MAVFGPRLFDKYNDTTMSRFFVILSLCIVTGVASAQHQHHKGMTMPGKEQSGQKPKADTTKPMDHSMHGMDMTQNGGMHGDTSMDDMKLTNYGLTMDTTMGMSHSLSRHLSMNRNAPAPRGTRTIRRCMPT